MSKKNKQYEILVSFKGSPNGSTVIQYTEGEVVDMVDSLSKVALEEKWAKVYKPKKQDKNK